jgi:uncharacterized protein (DUF2236 family)
MAVHAREILTKMPRRPPPGAAHDPGRFSPGSVARRINAETRLLLGGPRALLLQLAHPMVAAAVADHSAFASDPFERLWNTLDLTLTIAFGDAASAARAAASVARTHGPVRGDRDRFSYRANDPELLAWVHATLVDTAIKTYDRFVYPLGPNARERYLRDMDRQGEAFGVAADRLWPSYRAFRTYVEEMTSALEVSDEARSLGGAVLAPDVAFELRPVTSLLRFITAGLMPAPLRPSFGLGWSDANERWLRGLAAAIRTAGVFLPDVVRRWPQAREADERLGRRGAVPR